MMFCPNSSNQMNPSNDGLIRMNGWSQVVPISMPWATPMSTPTPINNVVMTSPEINRNVMQFTANIPSLNPPLSGVMTSTLNSVMPISASNRSIDNDFNLRGQVLCPDPCTSQTATRWELLNNISTGSHSSHQHLKRRNDSSDEELEEELRTPIKQHISEDKVSAIFNRLHITNNDMIDINDKIECEEFDDQTNETKNSIIFADELQTAIKNKTITDRLVQNELDKHSKAVVLWQPICPLYPPIGQNCDPTQEVSESESDFTAHQSSESTDLDIETYFNDFDNQMEL